ncbi:MAG TPA: R3H domain-containing nucleic acid-binding protein [Candidatus Saccharimonadia bacterium]|jgi:spoIIIJ-associated protein|nr:R3H domain-containing nucleic acid-binding protein [Candidatus Saccharimonadia bacterium]
MSDTLEFAKLRLEEMVAYFGVNVRVDADVTDDGIKLSIGSTPASPRLIGHHGDTLRSLEYLLNQIVKAHDGLAPRVSVDIAGYKEAQRQSLEEMAREVAERVKDSGSEEELKPMNPADRRIVHMALRDIDGVESESRGDGRDRRIVVKPA